MVTHPHSKACVNSHDHQSIHVEIILLQVFAECIEKHGFHRVGSCLMVSTGDKSLASPREQRQSRKTVQRIRNILAASQTELRANT
jgi:hypothetical protein